MMCTWYTTKLQGWPFTSLFVSCAVVWTISVKVRHGQSQTGVGSQWYNDSIWLMRTLQYYTNSLAQRYTALTQMGLISGHYCHICQYPKVNSLPHLLRVPVEEEVGHDFPGQLPTDSPTQPQDLATKKPPHQTQRTFTLQWRRGTSPQRQLDRYTYSTHAVQTKNDSRDATTTEVHCVTTPFPVKWPHLLALLLWPHPLHTCTLTKLLQGMAMSMYFIGELVLQNEITGMFT